MDMPCTRGVGAGGGLPSMMSQISGVPASCFSLARVAAMLPILLCQALYCAASMVALGGQATFLKERLQCV